MKLWIARLSIQRKLYTLLTLGFTGFLVYFAANFVISGHNQRVMNAILDEHLPTLELSESLVVGLGGVKIAIAQNAFAAGLDSVAGLDEASRKVNSVFQELKARNKEHNKDLTDAEVRFQTVYKQVSETLQNVVVGLDSLSSVQGKLQKFSVEVGELEKWAVDLKSEQGRELRASIDSANGDSINAMYVGWLLVFGGIPFALLFYLIMRDTTMKLQHVSGELTSVVQNVIRISSDASASSSRLASASSEQASAVTESVSSMDEMKSMLGQTVQNSAEALRSSEESFREAADGQQVIDDLRRAMVDIERAYGELEEVNQVVTSIRSKTNVINDIVFKTQLLSFNASIEAARAGQHGRGFSVVAAEVGKLAEMSGVAAQEIGKLLDTSTRKVAEIVESTKEKVGSANSMSMKCALVFEKITDRAGQAKQMVDAISGAAAEQEAGIQQVGRAMIEMKDSTDQTDLMAHEIASLADSLRGQSQFLASAVEGLEILVHGAGANVRPPAMIQELGTPEEESSKVDRKSA